MNREILFRGKKVNDGKWEYGCFYREDTTDSGKSFIVVNDFGFIEVIHETVGQFTGLTDRNGEKIFEGDIVIYLQTGVKYSIGIGKCIVRDNVSGYGVYLQGINGNIHDKVLLNTDYTVLSMIKIIGNIYDNPELLTDKE